jgi:hypothetical protein
MIPNTTPENFCQNRGGFNCRHICYPIRRPKEKEAEPEAQKVPEVKLGFDKKFDEYVNSEDINDEAKILIDRLDKPNDISFHEKGSYFVPSYKIIKLNNKSDKNTFFHEYGHFIDTNGKKVSLNKEFVQAYEDDVIYLKKLFKGKNLFEELKNQWKGKPEFYGASDILDSLSSGVFYQKYNMYGHGKKYYKTSSNKHAENFANIFQAWSLKDKTSLDNIKKYYPNLFKEFENILKTL